MVAFKDLGPGLLCYESHRKVSNFNSQEALEVRCKGRNQTEKLRKGSRWAGENPTLCVVSYKPGKERVQDRKSESSSLEILREKRTENLPLHLVIFKFSDKLYKCYFSGTVKMKANLGEFNVELHLRIRKYLPLASCYKWRREIGDSEMGN